MKKKYSSLSLIIFFLLFLFNALNVFSQNAAIKGIVKSADGRPIELASVTIKGQESGVITDAKGAFTLNVPQGKVMVVSAIGYQPFEVKPVSGNDVLVILNQLNTDLDQVVVIGYGKVKKSNLTGSVAQVKTTDLKQTPIISLDQGLQGRAAGVQVNQNSGAPGGAVSIRIRGGNSVSSSNEPLYVIDGFPVSGAVISPAGPGQGANQSNAPNVLSGINPNDIESIEILKDASATAIYGSRGANGVVLITTKRGKAGKTRVDFENYLGTQQVNRLIPMMNAAQFAKVDNELNPGRWINPDSLGEGTNWQKELFRKAAMQSHQVTISGGSEKTQFSLSGNYFKQDGIIIGSKLSRGTFRINLDHKINSFIKIGTNITFSQIKNNIVGNSEENGVVYSTILAAPTIPAYNQDGSLLDPNVWDPVRYTNVFNPLANAIYPKNEFNTFRLLGNLFADVQILKNLSYRVSVGADIYNERRDVYFPRATPAGLPVNGTGGRGINEFTTGLLENIVNYSPKIGKNHALDITGVYSTQKQVAIVSSLSASSFPSDALRENNLNLGATQITGTNKTEWRLDSYTGRLNYGFRNKYLVSLTGRVDGSSRFGSGNKYGFFPAAAFAWRVIEESFMKNQHIFDDLKFRFGYGKTGNAEVPLYQSLQRLGTSGGTNYIFNNSRSIGIGPLGIANPNLKWESTTSYNAGIDFSVLNRRLNFVADVYYKKTSDLLLGRSIASSSGFSSYFGNFGEIENKGVELGLEAVISKTEFKWNAAANISFNRNKLLKIDGIRQEIVPVDNGGGIAAFSSNSILRVGNPVGSFFGYVWDGIWQTGDNIAQSHQPSSKPGNPRYKDVNEDKKLTDADRTIIGDANPDFIYAFSNNLSYKNFEFNFFFQGVQGNQILNILSRLAQTASGSNQIVEMINRWSPTNTNNDYPKAVVAQRMNQSDKYVEDGSYLRLKNATVAYNFMKLRGISKLRVYISGTNLLTFTNYKGLDPEINTTAQGDVTNFGIDNGGYPVAKTFVFGVQIGL